MSNPRPCINVGLIGTGWIARLSHGPALKVFAKAHPQVCLRAVSDISGEKAVQFAKDFGFQRHYTDAQEMLSREKLDAVYVLVPEQLMAEVSELSLALGIPTLMEKPPGKTVEEVERLAAVAEANRTPHFVAFNRRCMPLVTALRRRLKELESEGGGIPEQVSFLFSRTGRFDHDFSTTAIHAVDTLSFLCESRYHSLRIDYHKSADQNHAERHDGMFLSGTLESGTHLSLEVLPDAGVNCERVDLHLPSRTFSLSLPCYGGSDGHGFLREYYKGELISQDEAATTHSSGDGFQEETERFLGGLLSGKKEFPGHDLESAFQSVAIMNALGGREYRFPVPVTAPFSTFSSMVRS